MNEERDSTHISLFSQSELTIGRNKPGLQRRKGWESCCEGELGRCGGRRKEGGMRRGRRRDWRRGGTWLEAAAAGGAAAAAGSLREAEAEKEREKKKTGKIRL